MLRRQDTARSRMRAAFALVALAAALAAPAARAALFEDDEARKAILDLRQRVDQNNAQLDKIICGWGGHRKRRVCCHWDFDR